MPTARAGLTILVLLAAGCATSRPGPPTVAVETTLGCVASVLENSGYREESRWRGQSRYAMHARFRRTDNELTVTVDEDGQGVASVSFSRGGSDAGLLQRLVRTRCLP